MQYATFSFIKIYLIFRLMLILKLRVNLRVSPHLRIILIINLNLNKLIIIYAYLNLFEYLQICTSFVKNVQIIVGMLKSAIGYNSKFE